MNNHKNNDSLESLEPDPDTETSSSKEHKLSRNKNEAHNPDTDRNSTIPLRESLLSNVIDIREKDEKLDNCIEMGYNTDESFKSNNNVSIISNVVSEKKELSRNNEASAYVLPKFGDPALYGSLPGEMDCLGSETALANGSSSNKQQKVIFCVHGKPSGCCVTRLQTDPTSPTQTITLATSTQTDPINVDDENKSRTKIYSMNYLPDGKCSAILLFSDDERPIGDGFDPNFDTEDHCHKTRQESGDKVARRKLIIASILCVCFMIAEVIGGVLSNSLAIATDAAHLLTDFASFMISLFALWVAERKPTRQFLFGWHRAEVIGALISVLSIWVVTGILVYVAIERILHEQYEIDSKIMLITSAFGVLVNLIMGCTLHQHSHGHDHAGADEHRGSNSINVRAAFIHVLGDFIMSTGVFIASILIYFNGPSWYIIDPICTFLFSVLVMITTFTILKDTMLVLMEGMPRGVEYGDVLDTLLSIQHVEKVHNLRIWALSLDKTALAAHIVISPNVSTHDILKAASKRMHSKFNFFEMTLQIEYYQKRDCNQCCDSEK